jgi:hypothetical protein
VATGGLPGVELAAVDHHLHRAHGHAQQAGDLDGGVVVGHGAAQVGGKRRTRHKRHGAIESRIFADFQRQGKPGGSNAKNDT